MHAGLAKAIAESWGILKPRDNLTVTQWADKFRIIQSGKYYSATTPYMREPMDCATDHRVGEIVIAASAQVSKTTTLENIAGYYIAHEPRQILMVMETLDKSKAWSEDKLRHMGEHTFPGVFAQARSRDARNTMLFKSFAGGDIAIVGANAPSGLKSRARNLVLLDETSGYEDSAGDEGDVEQLAIKRTETFPNALVVRTSTPTVSHRILDDNGNPVILPSRIFRAYNRTDKREWWCKCPHCDQWATLKWSNVRWEENNPKTAHYVCESCKTALADADRFRMAMNGEWRPSAPFSGKAGFCVNGLVSPFPAHRGYVNKLHEYAEQFIEGKRDPNKLRVFINTVLAEDFCDFGAVPDTAPLFKRRESYSPDALPDDILCLTAGVDVQGDRLELQVVGWGEGEECWIVGHWIIPGDPAKKKVWEDSEGELTRKFSTRSGETLTINCALIDSGDGKSQKDVYKYVIPRQARRIYASKGDGRQGHPVVDQKRPSNFQKKREPIFLVHIGTDTVKDMIFHRCKLTEIGPKYIHFVNTLDAEWFNQFSGEEQKTVTISGKTETRWVQIRARNEALDCFVMNFAAVHLIRPQWDRLQAARKKQDKSKPETETEKPEEAPSPIQLPKPVASPKVAQVRRSSGFMNWRK